MIFSVSNKESDIKELLLKLRSEYGDYAFISYIDGEYGIRIWVYNSLVYAFYNLMKSQNRVCIGIVFKNTKSFLNNLCDHIIEIDDVEFHSNALNSEIVDNNQYSTNHTNSIVPTNSYYGNDAWDLVYIRGMHSKLYEDILLEMNYSNIFYTLHVDGSRYINIHGCNTGHLYKVNNENAIFKSNDINVICINSRHVCEKYQKTTITNNIVIWIRNSNKWPHKNTPKHYYESLFDYCITNNKNCYVFQDIVSVALPVHNNIIECNDRIKNRPDFDNFIKICSSSDVFIGADSGPYYLLLHQPIPILKICYDTVRYGDNTTLNDIKNEKSLIKILQEYYAH